MQHARDTGKSLPADDRLAQRLAAFSAHSPVRLARTGLATLWRVTLTDGRGAVLKLYHRKGMGNERAGLAYLQACGGRGAVRVLGQTADSVLLEALEGPLLGDLSRAGRDAAANACLAELAARLHARVRRVAGLAAVDAWFDRLFALRPGPGCPMALAADMGRAAAMARRLLDTTPCRRPLHGDLHHDNVILTDEGPKAFDAKGVLGDPGFELANAFRTPADGPAALRDPARARALARLAAAHLGVDETRLLAWAAAKCALSIAWRAGGRLDGHDREAPHLALLLALAEARP